MSMSMSIWVNIKSLNPMEAIRILKERKRAVCVHS